MSKIFRKTKNVVYSSDLYKSLSPMFLNMKKENDLYLKNNSTKRTKYQLIYKANFEMFPLLNRQEQGKAIIDFNLKINNQLN